MNDHTESKSGANQQVSSAGASYVVADIGGTNARFAIYSPDGSGAIVLREQARFFCREFSQFSDAFKAYVEQTGQQVEGACISIAAPADGDRIRMTNLDWSFSISEYKKALGLNDLLVINDGVAAALATTRVEISQLEVIKPGEVEAHGSRLNLIPGTGFGLGCIVPHNGGWVPVQSEGGHATLAAVEKEEFEVLRYFTEHVGRAVSDRILSGPGMFNIYKALAAVRGESALDVDAPEMTKRAMSRESKLSADALDLYLTLFGRLAGDLALTVNAHGGVYLSGSLMQLIGAERISQSFTRGFVDKDRMTDKVERIPVYLLRLQDQCLLGASVWIDSHVSAAKDGR